MPARRADPTAELPRHPLLAALGRDVRELQLRLAAVPAHRHRTIPRPDEPPATLLQRLQRDLRDDRRHAADTSSVPATGRVQVHACHGPHRQVEVLREIVLGLLADDPTLEPRDVLVACPDVETFAPLVSAAFGLDPDGVPDDRGHPGHRLAVRLADRALRQVNPLLDVAGRLLELADARLTASEVLDLLAAGPVRRRFGLDGDDLDRLRDLATRAGVRWGLAAAHRRPYRLDGFPQNTWAAGLDRLLLGVAMEGERWLGTALPLDDVESGDVDRLGRLAEFVDRLSAALDDLSGERPLAAWVAGLVGALDALTATTPADAWQTGQARAELADVAHRRSACGSTCRCTSPTCAGCSPSGCAGGRGGPTSAPARSPSRRWCRCARCRTGWSACSASTTARSREQAWTTATTCWPATPASASATRAAKTASCCSTRCARRPSTWSSSTPGADARTGARRPPAVPLGELLDAVAATAGPEAVGRIVVRHPLQPFDARNFTAGALGARGPFSFDRVELAGCRAGRGREGAAPAVPPRSAASAAPATTVALDDLVTLRRAPGEAVPAAAGRVAGQRRRRRPRRRAARRAGRPAALGGRRPAAARPARRSGRSTAAAPPSGGGASCRPASWARRCSRRCSTTSRSWSRRAPGSVTGTPESRDVDVTVASGLPDGTRVVGTVGGVHGRRRPCGSSSPSSPRSSGSGRGCGWSR